MMNDNLLIRKEDVQHQIHTRIILPRIMWLRQLFWCTVKTASIYRQCSNTLRDYQQQKFEMDIHINVLLIKNFITPIKGGRQVQVHEVSFHNSKGSLMSTECIVIELVINYNTKSQSRRESTTWVKRWWLFQDYIFSW